MKTPFSERLPAPRGAGSDDDEEDAGGDDAPPVPDEEPDGEPDPAFD
ncbi:MAG TPA: hypothetical protein VGK92_13485 [Gaiellales bacterium]|jgi:hypothetical protein